MGQLRKINKLKEQR